MDDSPINTPVPSRLDHPLLAIGLGFCALLLCLWLVTDRRLAGATDVGDAFGMAIAAALSLASLGLGARSAFGRHAEARMTLVTCTAFASIVFTVLVVGLAG